MTLSRPSPPADDITPGRRSTHALQAIRRPEAERDTCPPSIDDPSDRPNRQTVQTSSTILEHTTCLQLPADELPPLVHTGPVLNLVQRIAEMKRLSAPPPAYHDTTGLRRLSSKIHVRHFDSFEQVMNEHVLGIYTRAPWRTYVSSRVSDLQVRTGDSQVRMLWCTCG